MRVVHRAAVGVVREKAFDTVERSLNDLHH
jgi:hypothetical protein